MSAFPNLSRLSLSVGAVDCARANADYVGCYSCDDQSIGTHPHSHDLDYPDPGLTRKEWPDLQPNPQPDPQPQQSSSKTLVLANSDTDDEEMPGADVVPPADTRTLAEILLGHTRRTTGGGGGDACKSGSDTEGEPDEDAPGEASTSPQAASTLAVQPKDQQSKWRPKLTEKKKASRAMSMRKNGKQRVPNRRAHTSLTATTMDLASAVRAVYWTTVTSKPGATPALEELQTQFRSLYSAMVGDALADGNKGQLQKLIYDKTASQMTHDEIVSSSDGWRTKMYALANRLEHEADTNTLTSKIDIMIDKLVKTLHLGKPCEMQQKIDRLAGMQDELKGNPENAWCTTPTPQPGLVEEL